MPDCTDCKKDFAWANLIYRDKKPYYPECWVKKQEKERD